MFHSVVIYTKDNCPWCEKMKDWFESNNIEFTVLEVGKDVTAEELKAMAEPGVIQTVPQVFIDGVRFGGYEDTIARGDDILRYRDLVM